MGGCCYARSVISFLLTVWFVSVKIGSRLVVICYSYEWCQSLVLSFRHTIDTCKIGRSTVYPSFGTIMKNASYLPSLQAKTLELDRICRVRIEWKSLFDLISFFIINGFLTSGMFYSGSLNRVIFLPGCF